MYKGGFIVPILMTLLRTVITVTIERYLTISQAAGKGAIANFVYNIKQLIGDGKISEAYSLCDQQKGSVASIVRAALDKYQQVEKDGTMTKEQKVVDI